MRAFFGVREKQLFLSLGQSWREPAGTEKGIFWVDFYYLLWRIVQSADLRAMCLFLSYRILFGSLSLNPNSALSCDSFRNFENSQA